MSEQFPASRRALIFLAVAFGITWLAWWALVALAQAGFTTYGRWPFMTLYVLGGLGPTIAAYVAVYRTREEAPLSEFNRRVLRWRVSPAWYLLALGLPLALGFMAIGVAVALKPELATGVAFKPWYLFPLYLLMTIIGGGLEEFGWRGIAQEEWGRAIGSIRAALLIGPIWTLWHLPLFFMPGVAQYHASFAMFLIGVMGNALLLGWLYSRTRSILLCVLMHAAMNAATMMGVGVPSGFEMSIIGPCLNLCVGALLFLSSGRRAAHSEATLR
ncbi:type II CAAX endopeptidase family protein [Dyella sp. C11]|uniref:type II CAAX endopeptidase family protein n=1 Tax=Dyella sp. C11 TaxID=2126991 RepID=UPI000D6435D5|nr:type II CAAX endopeptidase family protein [Dyella sp. C11]